MYSDFTQTVSWGGSRKLTTFTIELFLIIVNGLRRSLKIRQGSWIHFKFPLPFTTSYISHVISFYFERIMKYKPYESAKLRALHAKNGLACQHALRAYVVTLQYALRAYMLTCQSALRAYVLMCSRAYVPMCLACLRAHAPTCFACLHAHVQTCLVCARANVSCALPCSSANIP